MGIVRLIALLALAVLAAPAAAQQGSAVLERAKAEKKAWIVLNMELAPAESESFWPLYEGYQKDLNQHNSRVVRLIEAYAGHYRASSLTEEGARKLYEESIALDESYVRLRKTHAARLAKALNARQVARYLQLEDRIQVQMRYELGANLPLIGDVKFTAPAGK
jgi:hypothetical protein